MSANTWNPGSFKLRHVGTRGELGLDQETDLAGAGCAVAWLGGRAGIQTYLYSNPTGPRPDPE